MFRWNLEPNINTCYPQKKLLTECLGQYWETRFFGQSCPKRKSTWMAQSDPKVLSPNITLEILLKTFLGHPVDKRNVPALEWKDYSPKGHNVVGSPTKDEAQNQNWRQLEKASMLAEIHKIVSSTTLISRSSSLRNGRTSLSCVFTHCYDVLVWWPQFTEPRSLSVQFS